MSELTPDESSSAGNANRGALPDARLISDTIGDTGGQEDHDLASEFRKKKGEFPSLRWETLEEIFSYLLHADNVVTPFSPMSVMGGRRSALPEDLSVSDLDALAETLGEVKNPDYRARVGDVLWLCRRDIKAARIAVDAYLVAGSRIEGLDDWPLSMERYERGLRLARQIEPKGELPKKILSHLEDRIYHYDGSDELYFTHKAIEFLCEFRFGDFRRLAGIADRISSRACSSGDFQRARKYLECQASLLRLAGEADAAEAALVKAAEMFVEEADVRDNGSAIAAHALLEESLRAFRARPSLRARIPELQKRIAAAGKKTLLEMQPISQEIDLQSLIEKTASDFSGLQLDDALLSFSVCHPPVDPEKIRSEALEELGRHPLQTIFSTSLYDEAGRKIAAIPAYVSADERGKEKVIEGRMDRNARLHRQLVVHGILVPALGTILSEHVVLEGEIEKLIAHSTFIPEGREGVFIKGISAGFQWDFCTALHLLVPQVENSLRHLLEQGEIVPRNIDGDGVEELWGIERLLAQPSISEMLNTRLVYELQSLLSGRFGPNIRNGLAHGFIEPRALNGGSAVYLWWILFHLAVLPTPAFQAYRERRSPKCDGRGTN